MEFGDRGTEDHMIAAFVRADIDTAEYGAVYRRLLEVIHVDREGLVDHPDLDDRTANRQRQWLLHRARGYGYGTRLFRGWPDGIEWFRGQVSRPELATYTSVVYDAMHSNGDLIIVSQRRDGPFVVMDGVETCRAGAPDPSPCLVGISERISEWSYWRAAVEAC